MSNYRFCGSSQIGKSHEVDDTVCQDSYYIQQGNGFFVAAVADGLGTSVHSDVASKIAAENSVKYCVDNITTSMSDEQILSGIKDAFEHANNSVKQEAGEKINDYDTTLTLAFFKEGELFYGHAGDSGILALCADGTFEEVTTAQQAEGEGKDRPVYPLINESRWVFEKFDLPVHAIYLMTDGMLNMTVPPILTDQRYHMDHSYLFYLYEEVRDGDDNELYDWINEELEQVSPGMVNYDDKTLVVAIDSSVELAMQPDEYYEFPSDSLYKSLLAPKPVAAAAAPQSFYEKVKGVTSKELWKKNRKMIAMVASVVVVFSLTIPVTVTYMSGVGILDPITDTYRPFTFAELVQRTFNPTASSGERELTEAQYVRLKEIADEEGKPITEVYDDEVDEDGNLPEPEPEPTPPPQTVATTPTPRSTPTPRPTPTPPTPTPPPPPNPNPNYTDTGTCNPRTRTRTYPNPNHSNTDIYCDFSEWYA
ncbi:MAG: protein phosphatase 2C domain-containing protein [Oscillospiraceae bacterium]|nr:protein phosphatase 2C domain-containing protein [Oscillospiraceae bacterium]